jgi:hypothetical protein
MEMEELVFQRQKKCPKITNGHNIQITDITVGEIHCERTRQTVRNSTTKRKSKRLSLREKN